MSGVDLVIWVALAPLLAALAWIDVRTHTLPTRLIAPGYAVALAAIAVGGLVHGEWHDARRAAAGWALMGGFYLLLWRLPRGGMGYGDVRLSGLLGLALGHLGWVPLLVGWYAAFLLGGLAAVGLILAGRRRQQFPFGPFMVVGSLIGVAWELLAV